MSDQGASVPDQATQAPPEAATASSPSGECPSRCAPAPWRIRTLGTGRRVIGADDHAGRYYVKDGQRLFQPDTIVVADCFGDDTACMYQDGNAHLIAAAPELYGALERLRAVIEAAGIHNLSNGVQLGPVVWAVKCTEALEIAVAALAKARGAQVPA